LAELINLLYLLQYIVAPAIAGKKNYGTNLLRSMFMLTLVFSYTFSNAHTDAINSKTSEADCQNKCQNKNVKNNNSAVAFTS
jgi:hypothetical protein